MLTAYLLYNCRFKLGLQTLGVLEAMQTYPEQFQQQFCYRPCSLTAAFMEELFKPVFSAGGSSRRQLENTVYSWWLDYLQEMEGLAVH